MKAAFGIVSLLVALAIVAVLVSQQLKTVKAPVAATPTAAYPDHGPDTSGSPQQVQQKVRNDLDKAMQDAAADRGEPTEK